MTDTVRTNPTLLRATETMRQLEEATRPISGIAARVAPQLAEAQRIASGIAVPSAASASAMEAIRRVSAVGTLSETQRLAETAADLVAASAPIRGLAAEFMRSNNSFEVSRGIAAELVGGNASVLNSFKIPDSIARVFREQERLRDSFRIPDSIARVFREQERQREVFSRTLAGLFREQERRREMFSRIAGAPSILRIAPELERHARLAERLQELREVYAFNDAVVAASKEDERALKAFTADWLHLDARRYWRHVMRALLEEPWWNAGDPLAVVKRGAEKFRVRERRKKPGCEDAVDDAVLARFEDPTAWHLINEIEVVHDVQSLLRVPGITERDLKVLAATICFGYTEKEPAPEFGLSQKDMAAGTRKLNRRREAGVFEKRWRKTWK